MPGRAVVVTCLGLLLPLGACTSTDSSGSSPAQSKSDERVDGEETADLGQHPAAERSGPLPGGEAASCVESYSPAALAARDFAFDGVVVAIGSSVSDRGDEGDLALPGVTFEVREWFSGGSADTVTVDMQTLATPAAEPSDQRYAYDVGSRLLISGEPRWGGAPLDAPIAWGCGFSRYYDEQTAAAWRDAFER